MHLCHLILSIRNAKWGCWLWSKCWFCLQLLIQSINLILKNSLLLSSISPSIIKLNSFSLKSLLILINRSLQQIDSISSTINLILLIFQIKSNINQFSLFLCCLISQLLNLFFTDNWSSSWLISWMLKLNKCSS